MQNIQKQHKIQEYQKTNAKITKYKNAKASKLPTCKNAKIINATEKKQHIENKKKSQDCSSCN